MVTSITPKIEQIWNWLEDVPDPEIPVISVVDLGIIRDVLLDGASVKVIITPTYTGCPAMGIISSDIKLALAKKGITELTLKIKIAPPWTTDWISEKGRTRLEEFGIAPPQNSGLPKSCPQCRSCNVELVSQFGSTPCKAQWRCNDCLEPFDYFKCI